MRPNPFSAQVIQGSFHGGRPQIRTAGPASHVAQAHTRGNAFPVPASLNLAATGRGQLLPQAVRQKMESVLGADFSDVRIHVGPQAQQIGALAFTLGSNLYFAPGQYNPTSVHGQRLIGHELTHVMQQRAGRVRNPFGSGVAVVQDPGMEAEADRMGMRVSMAPQPVQAKMHGTGSHTCGTSGACSCGCSGSKGRTAGFASNPAPHVQAAFGGAQPKGKGPAFQVRTPAPHVQAAVAQPSGAGGCGCSSSTEQINSANTIQQSVKKQRAWRKAQKQKGSGGGNGGSGVKGKSKKHNMGECFRNPGCSRKFATTSYHNCCGSGWKGGGGKSYRSLTGGTCQDC